MLTEWIRCVDRMPENDDVVLVANGVSVVRTAYWDGEDWREPQECTTVHGVHHWMPLPEAP